MMLYTVRRTNAASTVQDEASASAKSKAFRFEKQQLKENEIRQFSIGFMCEDLVKSTTGVRVRVSVCVFCTHSERANKPLYLYMFMKHF